MISMKEKLSLSVKPHTYLYAACFSVLLIVFSVFVLLDAFVIPKAYAVMDAETTDAVDSAPPADTADTAGTKPTEPVMGDMSYQDENIDLKIEKVNENGVVFYVAELKLSDVKYIKTAFAKGTFGKNINEKTSVMAEENNALFAINGDYCGFRDTGVIMRGGKLLRTKPRSNRRGLVLDKNGELLIIDEKKLTKEKLEELGAVECFSFGPTLVVDGKVDINDTGTSKDLNPRTAIGQIEPLHYLFIVVDGRTKKSKGMKFPELAEEFYKRGCKTAYNLDGGGSATMWFNGRVINSPTDGKYVGEREVSDIIYIGKK